MTIDAAIEISTALVNTFQSFRTPNDVTAIKLGIEALKEKLERQKRGEQ